MAIYVYLVIGFIIPLAFFIYVFYFVNKAMKSNAKADMEKSEKENMDRLNYMEGLEWTMKYYTTGCPDWRWCYNYNYPPLLQDLIRFIPYFNTEFVETKTENPVSELVQLCYVLPRQSLHFLPEKLYYALIRQKLDQYKTDCEFSWAYCKYFWECHPNLPHIDVNELELFVENNK